MAGRAGRRGLDKIGVVIHLLNMFNDIPINSDYKHIVDGNSQQLISKFKIHSNLLLRIIYNNQDTENFITSSMITNEIKNEFTTTEQYIVSLKEKRNKLHKELKYYDDVLKYTELIKTIENSKIKNANAHSKMYQTMKKIIHISLRNMKNIKKLWNVIVKLIMKRKN